MKQQRCELAHAKAWVTFRCAQGGPHCPRRIRSSIPPRSRRHRPLVQQVGNAVHDSGNPLDEGRPAVRLDEAVAKVQATRTAGWSSRSRLARCGVPVAATSSGSRDPVSSNYRCVAPSSGWTRTQRSFRARYLVHRRCSTATNLARHLQNRHCRRRVRNPFGRTRGASSERYCARQ